MKLNKYLGDIGISKSEFARRTKISRNTILNILAGKNVSSTVIKKIEKATKGAVTFQDLT